MTYPLFFVPVARSPALTTMSDQLITTGPHRISPDLGTQLTPHRTVSGKYQGPVRSGVVLWGPMKSGFCVQCFGTLWGVRWDPRYRQVRWDLPTDLLRRVSFRTATAYDSFPAPSLHLLQHYSYVLFQCHTYNIDCNAQRADITEIIILIICEPCNRSQETEVAAENEQNAQQSTKHQALLCIATICRNRYHPPHPRHNDNMSYTLRIDSRCQYTDKSRVNAYIIPQMEPRSRSMHVNVLFCGCCQYWAT